MASKEPTDLTKLFDYAGVQIELGKCIIDMGINTVAVFARIALSPEELRSRVIQSFTSASKETDSVRQTVDEATVTAAWDAANRNRTALTVAATVAAAAHVRTMDDHVSHGTQAWYLGSSHPGVRDFLVASTFFGVPRWFWHVCCTRRLHACSTLGEILKARAHTAGGLINPLATKQNDDKLLGFGDSAELVSAEVLFDPQAKWAKNDSLEAIKWAYAWCGYGTDDDAGLNVVSAWYKGRAHMDTVTNVSSAVNPTMPLLCVGLKLPGRAAGDSTGS